MWSVCENEFITKIEGQYEWVKILEFFSGDLSQKNIDFENDWRFCAVKGKRKQVKFLGTVETDFPVKFPLTLNNGIVLEDVYYRRRNFEDNEETEN